MNRTTNLFVLLIVISFIFPATAIRYAQAASATPVESTENNATSPNESTENNATSPANMTKNNANMTCSHEHPEACGYPPEEPPAQAPNPAPHHTANARQEMPENATSTSGPENATSTGGPMENTTSPTVNNGTGTTPVN
ncbi:MAG: hypothetical protein WBF33_16025, partial [Candidatus Nitrosopolaris sp.]